MRGLGLLDLLGQAHARAALGLILALAAMPLQAAEAPPPAPEPSNAAVTVGQVIVNGHRQPACSAAGGHGFDLACLNSQLQAAATAGAPSPPAADAVVRDAQTPSKAGTFSQTATAERLGKNFGHSAQPYRPPAPVYSNPILPTGAPR